MLNIEHAIPVLGAGVGVAVLWGRIEWRLQQLDAMERMVIENEGIIFFAWA